MVHRQFHMNLVQLINKVLLTFKAIIKSACIAGVASYYQTG